MIENLEELARDDCARRSFGLAFFDEHLAIVAHYANRLAECLGANAGSCGTRVVAPRPRRGTGP